MAEGATVANSNEANGKESLKLAKLLITPFTFVASTCLQSGISLIDHSATPAQKGRCFHLFMAATISVFGMAGCMIAIVDNKERNAQELDNLMSSLSMILFVSLSTMLVPLLFSLLYVVYDISATKASWSIMGASLVLIVGYYVKKLFQGMRIPLRATPVILFISFAANTYGYTLYR
ncbi:hypothetical protein SELMODRAFT_448753 [Selaginella moellendorffii]|uniref:Uncharacterized protein n=1 Tax=Selaginella moellendorffii TaxID=88036 RepID=D8T9Y0_SELML|nr:hypothetical protein SELMODRAFT_448753 [Selaginella moellendorffii]